MSKIEVNQISSQCGSTLTIGQSGDTVTLACGASQTGFGRTGTVNWDTTAKTSAFTAVSGNGYFVNTTSGAITVTLPASPSAGDIVAVKDYAGTASTNNITVARNSSNIEGEASNYVISAPSTSFTFVYVDATRGWSVVNTGDSSDNEPIRKFIIATGGTITTCGDFKVHTFTSPGTFCVSCAGNPLGSETVDYMVVAGGGGSGVNRAGGGGAGGWRASSGTASGSYTAGPSPLTSPVSALPVSATGYPITVGAGGAAGGPTESTAASPGANSIFSTVTSAGGGHGSPNQGPVPVGSGGSGGGNGADSATEGGNGGSGNTPPVSPPQGNPGGNAPSGRNAGAGGGGATQSGSATPAVGSGGPGGNGATSCISFSPTAYAGGGGGGAGPGTKGSGGTGGGGDGAQGNIPIQATAGAANTGGGAGGGGGNCQGRAGGSGIVIIRYKYQ